MANVDTIKTEIAQDEQPVPIPIYQKNGEPYLAANGEQCTISVLGADAKKVKDATNANQRRLLNNRRTKLEPADITRGRITRAAAAVTGWFGWTEGEAGSEQDFPPTAENVLAMLEAEHILDQVEAGIVGHADFFTKSSSV